MIHTAIFSVMRAKRTIKNEGARAVLVLLISFILVSQVSFAGTDLILAAYDGNLSQVISLVKKGLDINYANNNGSTALLFAAQKGHLEIVKYLIEKGADVNHVNNDGFTALYLAVANNHLKIAKYLQEKIKKTSEVNHAEKKDLPKRDPTLSGSELTKDELIEKLWEITGARLTNQGRIEKLMNSNEEGIKDYNFLSKIKLPKNKAETHPFDKPEKISKEEFKTTIKETWFAEKITKSFIDLQHELQDKLKEFDPAKGSLAGIDLALAAKSGNLSQVMALVEKGVDVNYANNNGSTALIFSAQKGHIEIVKYLIEKGAEVNHADNNGVTALYLAVTNNHLEIAKYLQGKIKMGAEVNHANNNGSVNTDTIDHKINENIGHIVAAFDPEELPGSFNMGYMDVNESLFTYLDLVKDIKNNVGYFDYQALLNIHIGKHSEYKLQNLDTIVMEVEKQFHLGKKIYSTILGSIGHFVTLTIDNEGNVTIIDSNNTTPSQLGKDERTALLQALNSQKITIYDSTKPIEFRFNKDVRAQQQKADNDCLIYSMLNASQIAKEGNINGYKTVTSFLNSGKIGKYEDYKQIGDPYFLDNKSISNNTTKLVDEAKAKFLKSYRNEIKKRFLQLLPPDIQDKYGYRPESD